MEEMLSLSSEKAVFEVVREFVRNLGLDPQKCRDEAELRSLGIDSLQAVDLVFQFEERLNVTIPMEDFNAKTVGDAVRFVAALMPKR